MTFGGSFYCGFSIYGNGAFRSTSPASVGAQELEWIIPFLALTGKE